MRKYIILLAFTLGCLSKSIAQNNNFESETIFIHTNESTFITGETLLYKIYCLNANSKELSNISKIAYVEIIDNNGISISRNKIALSNGIGTNQIFINTSYNTGKYKLIAYTNWMQNNSKSKYFESEISIINPFSSYKNKEKNTNQVTTKTVEKDIHIKNENKLITLQKNAFAKREKVELNITSLYEKYMNGNFSISVRKTDNLSFNKTTNSNDFIKNNSENLINSSNVKYLPELRGELLSGKIITNNLNKTVDEKHIALSIIGDPFEFKIVKTNSQGEFHFILDPQLKKSDIILQIFENDLNDYQIILNPPTKTIINNSVLKNDLFIPEDYIKDIEARLVACQIENAYAPKDNLVRKNPNFIPFYGSNAQEFILDDYKRFPTFKEIITEIIPSVYFKESKGNYNLYISDHTISAGSYGSALVLVDGLLLQDVNELFTYNTNNIYKIDVVKKAYSYGSKIFSGVISITTFNREYNPKSKNILPVQIERCISDKPYQNFDFATGQDYSRFPDYRYQLAWETNFQLSKERKSFSFFTSDIDGIFEINIEGFSLKGEPISIKEYFEVK